MIWSIASRRTVKSLVVALVGLVASGTALSCTLRHQLVMADGQRACLTDFPIANEHVSGTVTTVLTVAPGSFVYSVAISTPSEQCPKVLVMEWAQWGKHTVQMRDDISAVRSAQAKRKCETQARAAGQPSCNCEVVLEDGNSPLTAAQLATRFAPQPGTQR
jgi:hypothetical protein